MPIPGAELDASGLYHHMSLPHDGQGQDDDDAGEDDDDDASHTTHDSALSAHAHAGEDDDDDTSHTTHDSAHSAHSAHGAGVNYLSYQAPHQHSIGSGSIAGPLLPMSQAAGSMLSQVIQIPTAPLNSDMHT
jgi:hypothetical protein